MIRSRRAVKAGSLKNTIPDKRRKHVPVREEETGKMLRIFKHKLVEIVILLVIITVLRPI